MHRPPLPARRAFTLVEMLVVIAIIGVLAALLIPTIYRAVVRAKDTRMAVEISGLASAAEAYKQKYGDYPPDFTNQQLVDRHIRRVFPNILPPPSSINDFNVNMHEWWPNVGTADSAEALVFWLGGLSSDPKRPFTGSGGPIRVLTDDQGNVTAMEVNDERTPLYDFDDARLTLQLDNDGRLVSNDEVELHGLSANENDLLPVYLPPDDLMQPYVYFESRSYGEVDPNTFATSMLPTVYFTAGGGQARPYLRSLPKRRPQWANDDTFQIICAGMDDHYGDYTPVSNDMVLLKIFPDGENYDAQRHDLDNLTNFSQGILEDSLP